MTEQHGNAGTAPSESDQTEGSDMTKEPSLARSSFLELQRRIMVAPNRSVTMGADDQHERDRENQARWDRWHAFLGDTKRDPSLNTFVASCDRQRAVLGALHEYGADIDGRRRNGEGLLFYGPPGTGKDHLLVATGMMVTLYHGAAVRWMNGLDLWGLFRDAIHNGDDEDSVLYPLESADVLYISDPLPPSGAITEYQAAQFARFLDSRYRACRPTWVTMNVANKAEAEARLGVPIVDRLRDGAMCIACNWPSYRKAAQ